MSLEIRRLWCGALRPHDPHDWLGQASCNVYTCPGHEPPRSVLDAETRADCAEEAALKRREDR